MRSDVTTELRDQIRGITGALLVVGLSFHFTMETWWLGWTLPLPYLVVYALVGLALVVLVTRNVGFHERDENRLEQSNPPVAIAIDFTEIVVQSFVASYSILLLLGVIDLRSSATQVMRLGLIDVVPLGFGAAMANRVFGSTSDEAMEREGQFPKNVGVFAVGALFVASPIAPTQEMELVAAHMGWLRHGLLVALTLALVYLILYELEFRGQRGRLQRSRGVQVGTVFVVYAVSAGVSFFLLLGFGHFVDAAPALVYQEVVILAFPASLGAAAAEVVI